jgi:hypothetical protein
LVDWNGNSLRRGLQEFYFSLSTARESPRGLVDRVNTDLLEPFIEDHLFAIDGESVAAENQTTFKRVVRDFSTVYLNEQFIINNVLLKLGIFRDYNNKILVIENNTINKLKPMDIKILIKILNMQMYIHYAYGENNWDYSPLYETLTAAMQEYLTEKTLRDIYMRGVEELKHKEFLLHRSRKSYIF